MKKKIKPVLIAAVVIVGVLFLLNLFIGPGFARFRAELAFDLFQKDFEQAAKDKDIIPFGMQEVIPHDAQEYLVADEQIGCIREGVEFRTGGWGIGSGHP